MPVMAKFESGYGSDYGSDNVVIKVTIPLSFSGLHPDCIAPSSARSCNFDETTCGWPRSSTVPVKLKGRLF